MDREAKMPLEMERLTCLQTLEFFNVGEELGCQIDELGSLKFLKGELEIRNLELVKGKEEAERADLSGKQNLKELTFCWVPSEYREGVESCDANVLEGLKPHQNLRVLRVKNFMGDRLPQWLGNLSKLVGLTMKGCDKCIELPRLGHLPCLQSLQLLEMENLKCIGAAFYGLDSDGSGGSTSSFGDGQVAVSAKKLFPALKRLYLESMKSLIEWEEAAVVNDDVVVFPALEDLSIESCSQLSSAPTHFPSLKRLTIEGNVQVLAVKNILSKVTSTLECLSLDGLEGLISLFDVIRIENLYQLESLRELTIENCPKIIHVGPTATAIAHLTSLKEFSVIGCDGLISIAGETLEGCTSLSWLEVCDCPNLISFPLDFQQTPSLSLISLEKCPKLFTDKTTMPRGFGHRTNLGTLHIGPFSSDDCSMELFEWSGLMSCSSTLQNLYLYGLPDMECVLPDEFQHFTALQHLELNGIGSIEALPDWFGNLASLKYLWDCEKLRYFPTLRRLTTLRYLSIRNCPLLKERYGGNSNPNSEWSNISQQIPNLEISFF